MDIAFLVEDEIVKKMGRLLLPTESDTEVLGSRFKDIFKHSSFAVVSKPNDVNKQKSFYVILANDEMKNLGPIKDYDVEYMEIIMAIVKTESFYNSLYAVVRVEEGVLLVDTIPFTNIKEMIINMNYDLYFMGCGKPRIEYIIYKVNKPVNDCPSESVLIVQSKEITNTENAASSYDKNRLVCEQEEIDPAVAHTTLSDVTVEHLIPVEANAVKYPKTIRLDETSIETSPSHLKCGKSGLSTNTTAKGQKMVGQILPHNPAPGPSLRPKADIVSQELSLSEKFAQWLRESVGEPKTVKWKNLQDLKDSFDETGKRPTGKNFVVSYNSNFKQFFLVPLPLQGHTEGLLVCQYTTMVHPLCLRPVVKGKNVCREHSRALGLHKPQIDYLKIIQRVMGPSPTMKIIKLYKKKILEEYENALVVNSLLIFTVSSNKLFCYSLLLHLPLQEITIVDGILEIARGSLRTVRHFAVVLRDLNYDFFGYYTTVSTGDLDNDDKPGVAAVLEVAEIDGYKEECDRLLQVFMPYVARCEELPSQSKAAKTVNAWKFLRVAKNLLVEDEERVEIHDDTVHLDTETDTFNAEMEKFGLIIGSVLQDTLPMDANYRYTKTYSEKEQVLPDTYQTLLIRTIDGRRLIGDSNSEPIVGDVWHKSKGQPIYGHEENKMDEEVLCWSSDPETNKHTQTLIIVADIIAIHNHLYATPQTSLNKSFNISDIAKGVKKHELVGAMARLTGRSIDIVKQSTDL